MSNRSGYSLARILTLGLVFHLVYIGTVFDCYFTSPVVHGMRPHRLPQAEAKRLVLIVGTETLSIYRCRACSFLTRRNRR